MKKVFLRGERERLVLVFCVCVFWFVKCEGVWAKKGKRREYKKERKKVGGGL